MASARARALLLGGIPLLALAVVVAVPLAEYAGVRPWTAEPRTLVEAAAAGEAARVIGFLNRGDDPARVYPVGTGLMGADIRLATAFEAAVWSGSLGVVRLLESRVPLDPETRQSLGCLAMDRNATTIAEYLGRQRACVPGLAEAQLVARTTGVIR